MVFFVLFIVHVTSEDHFIFPHPCERDILSPPLLLRCPTTKLCSELGFLLALGVTPPRACWHCHLDALPSHPIHQLFISDWICSFILELTFCSSFCVISIIHLAILKGTEKDLWCLLQIFCIRLWMPLISRFPHPNDLCTLIAFLITFITYGPLSKYSHILRK